MFFYARPHLFPLPQERTLLRTIFKHLDAGRANTADGEWEVRRRTIRLLLSAFAFGFGAIASKRSEDGGEKAGMRAGLKTNRRTAPTVHRPIPVLARGRKKVVISINETGAGGSGFIGDCPGLERGYFADHFRQAWLLIIAFVAYVVAFG